MSFIVRILFVRLMCYVHCSIIVYGVCDRYLWLFFFFFFKQKTAYEMRISDWSSDVCSSDLQRVAAEFGQIIDIPQLLHAANQNPIGVRRDEIGRASCRERVCQYV